MAWFVELRKEETIAVRTPKIAWFKVLREPSENEKTTYSIKLCVEGELYKIKTCPFNYEGDIKPLIAAIIEMCHDPSPTIYTIEDLLKLAEKHKKTLQ